MLIVFILIVAFCIIYLQKNYRNKIAWVFASFLTGTGLLLFASLMYFAKLSNYPYPSKIDYHLYIFLMQIKLNITDIARIYNIGIALILTMSVILSANISKYKRVTCIALSFPILYYMWSNDPSTTYNYFLDTNGISGTNILSILPKYNKYINALIFFVYTCLPFISLIKYYFRTNIKLKKRSTLATIIWLGVIYTYIFSVFVYGQFSMFFPANLNYFKFPQNLILWNHYILIPLTIFIIIFLFFIAYYYKPFNNLSMISHREMKKNYKLLSKNFRMLFHVYKNLFFTIEKLAEQGENNLDKNPELCKKNYGKIQQISKESVDTITRMLDMIRDIHFQFEYLDIYSCIDKALESVNIPQNIKIIKHYNAEKPIIYTDKLHFTEVFINLINNAIDAIGLKREVSENDFDAHIIISVSSEDDTVIIELEDNGCGIEKKNLKNIFKPLFSTKQSAKNWGIGLNYVYNVIGIHNGNITACSEFGTYTKFEILLPKSSERSMRKYEKNKISYM